MAGRKPGSMGLPNQTFFVRARITLGCGLVAGLLCAGCATTHHSFPLTEVSPGIFEGYKPWKQADFETLRAHGIRTILSLEQMPWDIWFEQQQTRRNGIEYRDVPILASPLEPREKQVKQALLLLGEPALRPVFVHCFLGKDRTTFIIGLYRVYYQHWTPQAAWSEMLRSGFHSSLRLWGFSAYFWHHTQRPDWVTTRQTASTERGRLWER